MAKKDEQASANKQTESSAANNRTESTSAASASEAVHSSSAQASESQSSGGQKSRWSGGTWKGKSAPVAEIARESISAAGASAIFTAQSRTSSSKDQPDSNLATSPSIPPSKPNSSRFTTPSKSAPTTKLFLNPQNEPSTTSEKTSANSRSSESKPSDNLDGKQDIPVSESTTETEKPSHSSGWLNWWGSAGKDNTEINNQKQKDQPASVDISKLSSEKQSTPDTMTTSKPKPTDEPSNPTNTKPQSSTEEGQDKAASTDHSTRKSSERSRASWFGLWGSGSGEAESATPPPVPKAPPSEPVASNVASDGFTALLDDDGSSSKDVKKTGHVAQPSSSWAFWSRDTSNATHTPETSKSEAGELAVANTKSESDPKPVALHEEQQKKEQASSPKPDSRKRDRPESLQSKDSTSDGKKQKPDDQKNIAQKQASATASGDDSSQVSVEPPTREGEKSLRKKIQKINQNQLLPPLRETYHKAESPSYFQQLFRLLGRSRNGRKTYLSLNQSQPKIRKAIAIGVHGYFPGALVARVIGQPTGTSIRFASGAATAIQKWAEENNCPCEIEKVALEGEGMIDSRVDTLWKLLLNWIDKIRQADMIMVACHSQGVPVTAILLARLLNFGCLSSTVRVGMCAMAGINLGPFSSYQSRILGTGTTHELFEFSRSQSPVSQAYASALTTCLQHHVRIVYIGSIDDQLVSLESSLFTTATHPYIYRAVFVDGRIHAPGFLTNLVGLACKLRNLGVSDHGLIRELSGPLAGSLYTGEGHSRIYEDHSVYELAVQHALETTNLTANVPFEIKDYEIPSTANANPYFLPWAMRGVLEEEFVRTELKADTDDLIKLFESWKPASKVLKDVKFRLEAVRSKL